MEALARRVAGERRVALLDLTREYRAYRHELLAACDRVLERMQLLRGEEVRAFESEMATYLGVRQVCGVASGTDALALALQAAGLEPGDEVLVQANAFVAAVEAIQRAGGTPVAVDIRLDDLGVAERVKLLGTHGQVRKNEHELYGANSRLDELHAAMLRIKLKHLDARNRRRAAIAAYYGERLGQLVIPPFDDPTRTHVYHQYVVRTPARDALRAHLLARGIETGGHYPVPIHRQPAWLRAYGETPPLPRAEQAAREMLSLPVHADLTDEEDERVAAGVVQFFERR